MPSVPTTTTTVVALTPTTLGPSTFTPAPTTKVTPSMFPKNGAVDAHGNSLCPCNPATGEPLGGAVIDKRFDVHVTDVAGQPIEGMCVTFDPPEVPTNGPVLVTDAGGRASIDLGTSPARYPGSLSFWDCHATTWRFVPKVVGYGSSDVAHFEESLIATGSVSGTVVDPNGQPFVGGCAVVISNDQIIPTRYAPFDAAGHFAIGGIGPGQVTIGAEPVCGAYDANPRILGAFPMLLADHTSQVAVTVAPGGTATTSFVALRPLSTNDPSTGALVPVP